MTVELDRTEIDTILRDVGHGVLSLASDGDTYAVPQSFGYDNDALYFQFIYDEDSRKMTFLESTRTATFATYTLDPPTSVIVRGELEPVPEDEEAHAAAAITENAEIPTLNVSPDVPTEELSFTFHRLTPGELSGRTFESDQPSLSSL